jgi:hypothetical protein
MVTTAVYDELTVMDSIITLKISETTDSTVKQSVYMVPQIETSSQKHEMEIFQSLSANGYQPCHIAELKTHPLAKALSS